MTRTINGVSLVHGDDWPSWMRNLYPVTYAVDAQSVRRKLAEIEDQLAHNRRQLAWYMRNAVPNGARIKAGYRREIDRLERYARNCRTQLRLIPTSGRDMDAQIRSMPTAALNEMMETVR